MGRLLRFGMITLAKTDVSDVVDGGVLGDIRVGEVGFDEEVL